MKVGQTWSLVLAGGEGSRLRTLTTTPCGTSVPKQFCTFNGERTLLEDAIERAKSITSAARTCVVVAAKHRHWWSSPLAQLPKANLLVQPFNRGTAIGILYPLLHILVRDPHARLVILPSDHYVRQEKLLQRSARSAVELLVHDTDAPILLGLEPEEPDPELGYIIPGERGIDGGQSIQRFIEKPPLHLAREIIRQGGLWNTFIIVASGQGLLNLFEHRYPKLVEDMRSVVALLEREPEDTAELSELYEQSPPIDFSRDVLEGFSSSLRVVRVPACGWSDLGTPKRVAETLRRLEPNEFRTRQDSSASGPPNLAKQHARLERLAKSSSRSQRPASLPQ
jgi:mannose-1-phosphate guanylyltransferase